MLKNYFKKYSVRRLFTRKRFFDYSGQKCAESLPKGASPSRVKRQRLNICALCSPLMARDRGVIGTLTQWSGA